MIEIMNAILISANAKINYDLFESQVCAIIIE